MEKQQYYSVKDTDSGNVIGVARAGCLGELEPLVMQIAREEFVGDDVRLENSISERVLRYDAVDVDVQVLMDDGDWVPYNLEVQHVNVYK